MIKCFCDRCGKEIIDNVNIISEETDIVDCYDKVIMKFRSGISHICDECQYNELTCGFKVGDEVITYDGRVGKIIDICTCDECKKRSFYEPEVWFDNGDTDYITVSSKNNGFKYFYKIEDRIFGNLDDNYLVTHITSLKGELNQLEAQLNVVKTLKKGD